ncbi:gp61 [Escherichia phage phiEB49]|uniref:Gp61 n=1 Tax=Escherichia phage phiEB49 TaxID=1048207 RepID=F8UBX1_9CAUD|nr:gp61 [Escherichia phage phiEB49]AEI91261.1 gp61 [Escherichia phage phiEB49]
MGRQCKSCQQSYEGKFLADSPEEAVAAAKAAFKIDLAVHKVSVDKVSLV